MGRQTSLALFVIWSFAAISPQLTSANTRGLGLKRHSKGQQEPGEPSSSIVQDPKRDPASGPGNGIATTSLPPCALVVFIHVHKTGGTTIRDWVQDMQMGAWKQYGFHKDPGVTDKFCIGNNCVEGISDLVKLARTDPAKYAEVHGRVFIEDHGGVHDIRKSLKAVQDLSANSNFTEHGCKALTFTVLREPKNYLISLARSHYKYLPFFDILMHRNGKIDIEDPAWRYDLMKIPHYLDNIQVRQLGMWCSSNGQKYPAYGHSKESEKWYKKEVDAATVQRVFNLVLERCDVVGLTHKIPELLVLLSDMVGFQHVKEKRTNTHVGLHDIYAGRDWYQPEMHMLEQIANTSHHDHTLYRLAEHKFLEQLQQFDSIEERAMRVRQTPHTK